MANARYVFAVFNFPGTTEEDLPLVAGEKIEVISRDDEFGDGWWEGINERGQQGLFPKIYTQEEYPVGSSAAASQSSLSESLARVEEEPESESSMDTSQGQESDLYANGIALDRPSIHAIHAWTPTQVSDHFSRLGLRDVAPKFEEHEVTGTILLEMQHTDLREIDINAFGKRFEIMKEIDILRHAQPMTGPNGMLPIDTRSETSTPPLELSQRSAARKSRVMPQHSATGSVLADFRDVEESQTVGPLVPRSNSAGHPSPSRNDLAPALIRQATDQDDENGDTVHVDSSNATSLSNRGHAANHKKSLSTSSIILGPGKSDMSSGRSSPEKRHSRTWSQDTVKLNSHKRGPSANLGSVGEEVAASITSSDSLPRSPSSPASVTLTSPSSASKPSMLSKKSLLGRRQKWRPNAVSENLEDVSASDAAKEADFSGWLRKRGEKTYNWKLRYFVLRGTRLAYYTSDRDAKERGLIDVNSHRVSLVDDILFYGPNRNTFKITPPAPGASRSLNFTPPKTHYFCADSKEQSRQWIAALTKATIGRDWSSPVISSCTAKTISLKAAREQRSTTSEARVVDSNGVSSTALAPAFDPETLPDPPVFSPDEITAHNTNSVAASAETPRTERQVSDTSIRRAVMRAGSIESRDT